MLFSCANTQQGKHFWSPKKKIASKKKVKAQKKFSHHKPSSLKRKKYQHQTPLLRKKVSKKSKNKQIFLALISNDYKPKSYNLAIVTNRKNQIIAIKTHNNQKNKTKTYGVDLFKGKIPLTKASSISLIKLQCINFDPNKGCQIQIEYPHNITYGSFHYFNAYLKKEKGQWGLYSKNRRFTHIRLIAKKWFGLPVGIQRVELQ